MKHLRDEWVNDWCQENGWTDLYIERNHYWAFPPGAFMPMPIPSKALRCIKAQHGMCNQEKSLAIAAIIIAIGAVGLTFSFNSPMPLIFAFAFGAITVALLEVEDL
ncbi:hypothetical protein [Thalassoporum mexicanum]|uniref:slr1957 family protein n=1 Tax=Thalassoporum mexicanum TaxID=3457544 RepID=UPI00059F06CE|nr:hypothetical protein [Pseudanabaena sp. PCC 7367]